MAKPGVNASPRHPQSARLVERRAIAVELRRRGLNFEEIAAYLRQDSEKRVAAGNAALCSPTFSKARAFDDVNAALRVAREHFTVAAEDLRQIEIERTEAAFRLAWTFAEDRDPKTGAVLNLSTGERLAAVDRALRASERLASLQGLDAPRKVEAKIDVVREAERLERETGIPAAEIIAAATKLVEEPA